MAHSSVAWLAEQVARVRELAAEGCTASQIGAEFHASRNAIVGLCHRRNIPLLWGKAHSSRPKTPRVKRPHHRKLALVFAAAPVLPDLPPPLDKSVAINPITIADLDMTNGCRWPVGDPRTPDFRYCGGEREIPGESAWHVYCRGHARVAFNGWPR
jgi:GcrA cell cycle regulator